MALREKFGRLVLLDETDSSPLGSEYRAARLGPSGFDRLVTVLRFAPAVSAHADACKRLVETARLAAQSQNPGLVRVLGVGRVGPAFYQSSELVEGRTLRDVLACCRESGFPFAADHALMIASRAAAGLELLHARKDDAGRPLLHGMISPRQLVVAFDGEVKLKGLGLWSALAGTELLVPEDCAYLAPEQGTSRGDARSDVYALGLVLLEALCGQAPDGADPQERIASARFERPGGETGPLPPPLADLLRRALGRDPASRFAGMGELRRAIDTLLFSGDFTPTTFDLAFFMHTLFRDEVERDARANEDARTSDYREFLAEDAAKAGSPPARTEPVDAGSPAPVVTDAPAAMPTEVQAATSPEPAGRGEAVPSPSARSAPASGPDASGARRAARASREAGAREAAARLSAAGAAAPRRGISRSLALALGLLAAVVVGGGAGWLYFVTPRRGASGTTSPEQLAAEVRVRELESRIKQLEREKAEAESRAADEARHLVEQQAAAGGRPVDPAAVARAQDEARRQARQEEERRQRQELTRLAEEKRAEEQRLAAATPTPVPTATSPLNTTSALLTTAAPPPAPTPIAAAEMATAPAATAPGPAAEPPQTQPGTPTPSAQAPAEGASGSTPPARQPPADPGDPAVRPPVLVSEDPVPYPARAIPHRIAAVAVVRALVDEQGRVAEAHVSQPSGQRPEYGFDDAALKRVRSRRYRPARRNDVPVSIWVMVRVEFRPPPLR